MPTTIITIEDGQKPTEEQLREVEEAAKFPFVYDPDCPPSSAKALAEFAEKARALRRGARPTKPSVTIRLDPECLEAYKALGKGYTGVMADVLTYAVMHPEILAQITS
jgi:uncharacterized protein (DUF4415 family)